MYTVSIADLNEFRDSREPWNTLVRQMHFPSIFCTWEWIYTWWEYFGEQYEPLILFIYNRSELVGIFPLARRKRITRDWLMGRTLTYCGSNELYPDHLDIICSQKEAYGCLNAVFSFLAREYKDWETLSLSTLAEDSTIVARLMTNDAPFRFESRRTSMAPFVPLSGSFDDYINTFDSKQRYNFRSRRKKLYEQHGMKYVACDPSRQSDGLKILFKLHELRAQRKNIVSTFRGDQMFEYHNTLVNRLNQHSVVSLRFLKNEKETIAASYNFTFEGRVFSYQKGIDPAWERFGPGMVIVYEAIQEAFARGYHEYNFLRGGEEYKNTWTKHHRDLFLYNIYNNSVRGMLARISSCSIRSVKRRVKALSRHATFTNSSGSKTS
jgi:hypothetical protein